MAVVGYHVISVEEHTRLENENARMRAALEEMLIIRPRDEAEAAFHRIARRALGGK